MKERESLTLLEIARLIDWLKSRGMSDTDAVNCIRYIASGNQPDSESENKDK